MPNLPQRMEPRPSAARRVWRKALSMGSTTSTTSPPSVALTERVTDLDTLDLERDDGRLTFDPQSGAYSGWLYVAEGDASASSGYVAFVKRFCRLQELVCKFYASASDAPCVCEPVARHVVISVTRVTSRNKAFAFVDHADATVLLHVARGADFERWVGTFAAVVKATQVAKPRAFSHAPGLLPRPSAPRLRAFTAPMSLASRHSNSDMSLLPVAVDEKDPHRTLAVWLDIQAPWWHHLLPGRQRMRRRYLVFSGASLSCFSVNKEGQEAEFTRIVTSYRYDCTQDAAMMELSWTKPHGKLQLRSTNSNSTVSTVAEHLQTALALQHAG
ncbi:hypothetical protein BBJ28_00005698 [Nothophytophthora sp. Chile5]|nr:hypothetical protein BBJ28_00005698 [Nothophytophthora sp. Chile5]